MPDFLDRPLVCIHADEGPKDNPIAWFLPANGFRIWVFMDPLHKCPRDLYAAAVASANWNMVLDTTYAINFYGGPFKSKAHWHQARDAADDFVAKATEDDVILLFCYEEACKDEGPLPPDFGEEEHIKKFLSSIKADELFPKLDSAVKWSRWGSHGQALRDLLRKWGKKLISGSALALTVGTYKNPEDLPLWGIESVGPCAVAEEVAEATPASAAASSSAGPLPIADAAPTSKVWGHRDDLKIRWENGLTTLLKILSDKELKTRAKIWGRATAAVYKANADDYEALENPIKTRELYLGWAQGSYKEVIKRTWEVLLDVSTLDYLGLTISASNAKDVNVRRRHST